MVTRRTGSNSDGRTAGGFLDSIIAKRQSVIKKKGLDHLASQQRITAWLDNLPLAEPTRAQEAALLLLLEQDSLQVPFTPERTDALFRLDRGVYPNVLKLESDYLGAKAGGELEQVLWRSCSDLGRAFIVTYERAFTDNLERLGSRAALQTLTLVLSRIIHFLAWQARLCTYRRADWNPVRWQQLHRLYRKARAFNVQLREVPDLSDPARRRKTTIESEYVSLLLLWRLNSGTLSGTEIAQAYYWLRDRPRHVLFVNTNRPGTRLGVDPTRPDGLKPLAHLGGVAEKFLFDSSVLAEPLTGTVARLEERITVAANDAERRRLRQQIELVTYLIAHWAVNAFTERAERVAVERSVNVEVGWTDIAAKLRLLDKPASEAAAVAPGSRAPAPARSWLSASVGSLVTRGWANPKPSLRSPDFWIVRNESASGCRVVSPTGKGGGLKVGDVIALHDPITELWDIALVRRWKLAGEDKFEMGLLWFGRKAMPLLLYPVRTSRWDEAKPVHALGGEIEGMDGETLLTLLPAAACVDLQRSWERSTPWGRSVLRIESIELPGGDWNWVRLRVIANDARAAGAGAQQMTADDSTEIEIKAPPE